MFTVRTYNSISEKGLDRFNTDHYRIGADTENPDAFILRSHKLHDEVVPHSLVAVARAGAGYNNIPVDDYTHRGIVVFNTPGANANAVKELVAAGLVLGSRGVFDGINYVRSLGGITDADQLSRTLEKAKKRFAGSEIAGKRLGIIGLGAIGSMVANMALELDMQVSGFDPALSVEGAWRLSNRVERVESLGALLGNIDYLSLHVPVNEHTRNLIDAGAIGRMQRGARLLNFAREEVVDIEAVVRALDSGQLSRYITDFPRPELFGRDDTVLLPHIGASTREAEENCAIMAAEQLMDFLENGNIVNSVNFPQTRMARDGGHRLTFWNHNVPKVLGAVLAVFAERDINVIDLVNKSHGDVAYNIIDLETKPSPAALEEVAQVEGMIRLREV